LLAPVRLALDEMEDSLFEAFSEIRDALADQRPVVVDDDADGDLLGSGQPVDAAIANALIGLVRALATEGVKSEWVINSLAVTADVSAEDQERWIMGLATPSSAMGQVVRLGSGHLGRLPV
jgi:hypothetical protein